jgi:hypothetical protein
MQSQKRNATELSRRALLRLASMMSVVPLLGGGWAFAEQNGLEIRDGWVLRTGDLARLAIA